MTQGHEYLEPACSIIRALGGYIAVARHLKVAPSTVYRWQRANTGGHYGGGGFVPREHHAALIELAAELGLTLSRTDFLREGPLDLVPASRIAS